MKHIVFTGGGTAGHVTPNIALFPSVKEAGYEISYIGSYEGIEKELSSAFFAAFTPKSAAVSFTETLLSLTPTR